MGVAVVYGRRGLVWLAYLVLKQGLVDYLHLVVLVLEILVGSHELIVVFDLLLLALQFLVLDLHSLRQDFLLLLDLNQLLTNFRLEFVVLQELMDKVAG